MERNGVYEFTLNVNHSVANALRRTIVAEIPVLVFGECDISVNTSRFTNEIIKQRIGCIPIQTLDPAAVRYTLTVSKKNEASHTVLLTTADFVVRTEAGEVVEGLLPPTEIQLDGPTKAYYIEFIRLKPGEELTLKCALRIGTCAQSGQYNAASICSYGCTQDSVRAQEEWEKQPEEAKSLEAKKNWDLLGARRIVKPDSFEFVVKTCSAYTNQQLVRKACEIIHDKLAEALIVYEEHSTETTLPNCTDVVLKNGDYTLGKLLEYQIFQMREQLRVTYVTFFKHHPHDVDGILRVAVSDGAVKDVVKAVINPLSDIFTGIARTMGGKPMNSKLAAVLKQFKDLPMDEKRSRLVSLGVDGVAAEPEERLDHMAERYLNRAERAQEDTLESPAEAPAKKKRGKKTSPNEGEIDTGPSEASSTRTKSPNSDSPKDSPKTSPNEAEIDTGPSEASSTRTKSPNSDSPKDSPKTSPSEVEIDTGPSEASSTRTESSKPKRAPKKSLPKTSPNDVEIDTGPSEASSTPTKSPKKKSQ